MSVQLLLQISVATLTAMGTALMGLGESDPVLPTIAVLVAISSVYLTDIRKVLRLNAHVANLTGLGAVLIAVQQVRNFGSETWLLAIAHLLVYLQFVLLFQEKTPRHYWLLLTLSLLQVAVAAALNLAIWFGLLLIVYLLLGLMVLALFFLHREAERYAPPPPPAPPLLIQLPGGKRPRAKRPVSRLYNGLQLDPAAARVGWPFVGRIATMCAFSLVLTVAVFILIPRLARANTQNRWSQQQGTPQRLSGFSEQVSINDLGQMLVSSEEVLRLRLNDPKTAQPYRMFDSPRLRGTVLHEYERGVWRRGALPEDQPAVVYQPPNDRTGDLVKQTIDLEPLDSGLLFGIYPWAPATVRSEVTPAPFLLLSRATHLRSAKFRYELLTWGLKNGRQVDVVPHYEVYQAPFEKLDRLRPALLRPEAYMQLVRVPTRRGEPMFTAVGALASRLITPLDLTTEVYQADPRFSERAARRAENGWYTDQYHLLKAEDVRSRAKQLERFLRDSGEFRYSLDAKPVDPRLDPAEDFVANRRSGHCEYFATTLALMLRLQRIPARIVNGYSGGDWNELGDFYQFRQYHAHSWVECYLPDGTWLTLDPTPADDRLRVVATHGAMFPKLQESIDYAEFLWSGYVLGLDGQRQQEHVYAPLQFVAAQIYLWIADATAWSAMFSSLRPQTAVAMPEQTFELWFSPRGAVLVLGLAWSALFLRWLIGYLRRPRGTERLPTTKLRFREHLTDWDGYQRLEMLLAGHELFRPLGATPREFAEQLRLELLDRPACVRLVDVPRRLAAAYYRVRFGGQSLTAAEVESLEQDYHDLQRALEVRVTPDVDDELPQSLTSGTV